MGGLERLRAAGRVPLAWPTIAHDWRPTLKISRILVIDNDDALCGSLDLLWSSYGITVHTCRNVREARKLARTLAVEACLLEAGEGLATFVSELREIGVKVVMMTGGPLENDELARVLGETGADGYQGKPFEAMELLRRIRTLAKEA